jgi:O-antigen/teichoic acid export membrane protein
LEAGIENQREVSDESGREPVEPLEHRAAKVSLVNGLTMILGVGSQLISVPVCLHYWGKETYGSWLALFSTFLLLRGLDGGYTAYVGNKLNYLYHKSTLALREHLSAALYGVVIISCLQLTLIAGAAVFRPMSTMIGISTAHTDITATLGLFIMMLSWALTGSYLGIVHRLMIPAGLMYQSAWWAMEFQLCQFGAIMISAILRLDMLQTSAVFALSQITSYVASALYVRYKLPAYSPWLRGAKSRVGLTDLGHSMFLTTSNLVQQCSINGSVLLVSALAGPVAVPVFTTVRTLTNLWTAVTTILSSPLLPDIVRIHANGQAQKLADLNQAYWVLVGSAVNLGAVLSYPLIPFLYAQWTGHAVALDDSLLCFLLASVVVANSGALMALHLNGINSLRIVLASSIVRAIFGLGGGALAFRAFGLAGFGLGIMVGEILATVVSARYFLAYEIKSRGAKISARYLGPIVCSTGSALIFLVGAGFGLWHVGWGWIGALIGVACASIWGWKCLESGLQSRLVNIPLKLLQIPQHGNTP